MRTEAEGSRIREEVLFDCFEGGGMAIRQGM